MTFGIHTIRLRTLLGACALAPLLGCASGASAECRPMLSERFGIVHRYTGTLGSMQERIRKFGTVTTLRVQTMDGRDVAARGIELVLRAADRAGERDLARLSRTPAGCVVEVVGWEGVFAGGAACDPRRRDVKSAFDSVQGPGWRVRHEILFASLELR